MAVASQKRVSFIIPWFDRPELAATLKGNRELFSTDYSQVIIVNAGGDISLLKNIVAMLCMPNVVVVNIEGATFNKCSCLNIGVSFAEEDIIFLLDCDILISKDVVDNAITMLRSDCFITIQKGIESNPEAHPQVLHSFPSIREKTVTSEYLFANGNSASVEYWQSSSGRSLCGLMLLHKKHYIEVGGSDSRLEGWGFEDFDLQIRLQAQLGIERVSTGCATHLTHGTGSIADREMNNLRNTGKSFSKFKNGNFFGTYSQDLTLLRARSTLVAMDTPIICTTESVG